MSTSNNNKNKLTYPCPNPFHQMYLLPRDKLYIRYCPFHSDMIVIDDYENLTYEDLNSLFKNNENARVRREAFINGDFYAAGCVDACEFMSAYRGGKTFDVEEYKDENGEFNFRKANLSMGPDCNIRCRYCLDPAAYIVDFGQCKPKFADFIVPLVRNGGYLVFTGGETFLPKWGLVDKLKKLVEYGDAKGEISIYTNGTFLTEEICDIVAKSPVKSIGISMDTFKPELFNYIRHGSDFYDVLDKAKMMLRKKNESGRDDLKVYIMCTVYSLNADHLEETADFFCGLGFCIGFNTLFHANYSPDFCEKISVDTLTIEQMENIISQLERIREKWGEVTKVHTFNCIGQIKNAIEKKKRGEHALQKMGGGINAEKK